MATLYPCRDRDADERRKSAWRATRSAMLWLLPALSLIGAGIFIARTLESDLLGFLGADFLFLIAAALYVSGPDRSGRRGR